MIRILFVILIPVLLFAQVSDAPKLTQDKLFQQIGELTVQVRLQAEYIDKLLTDNKTLKDENEKLKNPNSSIKPN